MTLVSQRARLTAWRRDRSRLPREAWVLIAANAVAALGYGVVSPVLPAFARTFGVSLGAVTFSITIFSVMRLFSAPPTGLLVQRLGERHGLRGRAADRFGVHRSMRVRPNLLAAIGIPRDRRHRVDVVLHLRVGSDDPNQPGRRARASRGPVRDLVSDRLGRRPAGGQSHRRFGAQSTVSHLRRFGADHRDRGVLQLAPVDTGRTGRTCRAGGDGACRASAPRVPRGAGVELRDRLGGVRIADGHRAALRLGRAGPRDPG